MFLLVGQLACNFLAMSFQTISPSLSGTWSHLLQTKMAHSGSNCCNNPFCSNSSCFLNIFTSWNYTKQTKLLSRILEMFMHIPCCVEIRSVVGLIIITDFFEKWMRLTLHNVLLFVILQWYSIYMYTYVGLSNIIKFSKGILYKASYFYRVDPFYSIYMYEPCSANY